MKLISPRFSCGLPGHVVKDCSILQKKAKKRRQKAKKEFKRAMIAAWSDSDSSKSEDEEEQPLSLCFMANENQTHNEETGYESSDEVDYSDLPEYSKDVLAQALIKCIQYEQGYLSKIKSLKKTISSLSFEKECLEKSKNEAHIKIETLEIEKKELQSNCEDLEKMVLKFSKGQGNLDKLLASQRMSFNKKVLDTDLLTKRKLTKTSLFKRYLKMHLTSYVIIV